MKDEKNSRPLSDRLEHLIALAGTGEMIADVGCDHAYVSIRMITEGRFKKAVAMDVRKGPLQIADAHIKEEGLEEYIECRLSDGIEHLKAGEADCILIAGMGGPLMCRILSQGWDKITNPSYAFPRLILQPQSEIAEVRKFIRTAGFSIEEEDMVFEDGKYYVMFRAVEGKDGDKEVRPEMQDIYDHYGEYLLRHKNPVLKEYLLWQQSVEEKVLEGLKNSKDEERARERSVEVKKKQDRIAGALACFAVER